jgi:hypothetical protein
MPAGLTVPGFRGIVGRSAKQEGSPMAQLTGSRLLAYVDDQNVDYSDCLKENLVLGAGYVRTNSNLPRYVDFHTELLKALKAKVSAIAEKSPGSKATQKIINAIKNKESYSYRNDMVINYKGLEYVEVFYHDSLIATINFDTKKVTVYNNSYYTKSTKDRLNRVLMHLCGVKLFQKNKKWIINIAGTKDIPFVEGMTIDMI